MSRWACVLALCLSSWPTVAFAQGSRLVSIESPVDGSPVIEESITRIVAELRAAGFEVELDSSDAGDSRYLAKLRLSLAGDELRVEITSDATASTVAITGPQQEVAAVALQSAEFLRAGLVPRFAPAQAPPAEDVAPKRTEAEAPEPPADRWLIGLSGALLTNWGAGDRLPLLDIAPGFSLSSRFAVGVHVFVPLADARFQTATGDADYRTWLALAGAEIELLRWSAWQLAAGVNAGVARSVATGRPAVPFEALDSALWSLALGADLSVDYQLLESLALSTQLHVLSLSPQPIVAVREYERGLGRPSLLASLGARVSF
jgi:hypothetical protein